MLVVSYFEFNLRHFEGSSEKTRETSNKALIAINEIHLIPFLMAFLENRDKLPLRTVVAAGMRLSAITVDLADRLIFVAQCLYVLTDDNLPAVEEIRSNSSYTSSLLTTAQSTSESVTSPLPQKIQDTTEERITSLKVLAAGVSYE